MVDNTVEINKNVPVMSYFSELSKKIPYTKEIEIISGKKGKNIALSLANLTTSLYSNVNVEINKGNKKKKCGFKPKNINLKLNMKKEIDYDPEIPELFEKTLIYSNNHNSCFRVTSDNQVYWNQLQREMNKKIIKKNREFLKYPIHENVSALKVNFIPNVNVSFDGRTRRHWNFERWGELYTKPPVSDKNKVKLSEASFSILKKKPETHYKADRDCKCLDLITGKKTLNECFDQQTEYIKETVKKGKKNILGIINCHIEDKDPKEITKENDIHGPYKYMYLKRVFRPIKAVLLTLKEKNKRKSLEKVVSNYNEFAEEGYWEKITLDDLNKVINNLRNI